MQKNEIVGAAMIGLGTVTLVAITVKQSATIKSLRKDLRKEQSHAEYWKMVCKKQIKVMTFAQWLEATKATLEQIEFDNIVKDL